MIKQSFDIPANQDGKWGSYISKYPADSGKLSLNAFSIGTRNVITSNSGQAEKRLGPVIWNPNSLLSGAPLDQYEGIFASGTRLLVVNDAGTLKASTGNGLFTTITSGYTNPANFEFVSYQNRIYGCNGVDAPISMDTVTSYGGVTYTFTTAKTKAMGAQAPSSAPTATRQTDSTANQVPAGSHTYKITFVYYSGVEESNGSAASGVCVNDGTHTSNALTSIPVGGYGCTARNIYRDDNDGNWLLLASISNNTATTYTDILTIGSTPTAIPTTHALPPTFKYAALYLDRIFVIDVTGKTIAWSTAGEPDVFVPTNVISGPADDVMTAVYVYNGIPWIFGQHTVGTILGTTDGSFYYNPISTTVGCVDNRSIQTRNIVSVPTLLWLSALPNKGIYYTNGSTIQYLSDFIEDLTFNLAQVSYLQRQNTQNSQSAFQGGTATPSIDLTTDPGTIETINPTVRYSHAADWLTGTLVNLAPMSDQLQVPTQFAPLANTGSLSGSALFSGNNVTLPSTVSPDESLLPRTDDTVAIPVAQAIDPARYGSRTLTSLTVPVASQSGTAVFTISIFSDSSGHPGSALYTSSSQTSSSGSFANYTVSPNLGITQGNRYWIVIQRVSGFFTVASQAGTPFAGMGALVYQGKDSSNNWIAETGSPESLCAAYLTSAISSSGTWTSPVYNTGSTTLTNNSQKLIITTSFPASTSGSIQVQDSSDQSTWTTTDTLSNPSGTIALTGGTSRYWRLIYTVSTTNNQAVPVMGLSVLVFDTTGTWTSPAILCTTDITALSALLLSASIPASTTATITIATSSDNITYSSFVAVGSATPAKWAKIKVTLTTDIGNTVSPTLLSAELDWAVTGTLTSSIIDTGAIPSGWGIFQFSQVGTSGTITFYFRSASSSGGIPGASWTAVSNGGYPTSSPLEFCQWKATISATVDNVPQINSVTVNWLLTSGTNIRAASLFFNKSYYLSVAIQGATANNLLIELDYEGNWRIHNGTQIGTMGTYFNDAFFCDATAGKVYNGFRLATDNGTSIVFDMRTKCFVYGDDDHLGLVRSLRVKGVNTGTTIHAYYSNDFGTTWYEMFNSSGTTGYATTTDGLVFDEYFIPNYDGTVPVSGYGFIYRVVSNDAFPCTIRKLKPTAYIRKGKAIREAMA